MMMVQELQMILSFVLQSAMSLNVFPTKTRTSNAIPKMNKMMLRRIFLQIFFMSMILLSRHFYYMKGEINYNALWVLSFICHIMWGE